MRRACPDSSGRALLVLMAALLLITTGCGTKEEPTRVMLVGDSLTQGRVGDWTWRYWAWQELERDDANVDFVGPTRGLYELATQDYDKPGYRDSDFDQDHASRWGASYQDLGRTIGSLAEEFEPDVIVDLLGTNDLGWWGRSVAATETEARTFIESARKSAPETDIVLLHLVNDSEKARAFNARLDAIATELDQPDSRVIIADIGGYFEAEDVYDGLHPTESGERRIARAVVEALDELHD